MLSTIGDGAKQLTFDANGNTTSDWTNQHLRETARTGFALATAINGNSSLQTLGVTAIANGTDVSPRSTSSNVTGYTASLSPGATETITLGALYQTNADQTATVGGTVSATDVMTITVIDSGLTGGQKSVNYTVQGGDTTTTIATALKNAINADTDLQAINVSATSASNVITITSHSSNLTTYSKNVTAGPATETVALSGASHASRYDHNKTNALTTISEPAPVAFKGSASKALKSASVSTQVFNLKPADYVPITYTTTVGGNVTLTVKPNFANGYQSIVPGGGPYTAAGGVVVKITVHCSALSGGQETVSYTLQTTDTYQSLATALASAINNNSNLQALKISATSDNAIVAIRFDGTTYTVSGSGTVTLTKGAIKDDGSQPITMGGGPYAAGYTATVTAFNSRLPGGQKAVTYTLVSTDTYESVAALLAKKFNDDPDIQSINMHATVTGGTSFFVSSASSNMTTFSASTSGGATETVRFQPYEFGNSAAAVGGKATSGDTVTLTAKHVLLPSGQTSVNYVVQSNDTLVDVANGLNSAVNGNSNFQNLGISSTHAVNAELPWSQKFKANALMPGGTSMAKVSSVDGGNNTTSKNYMPTIAGPARTTLTYDANGNMTFDGTNQYLAE